MKLEAIPAQLQQQSNSSNEEEQEEGDFDVEEVPEHEKGTNEHDPKS